MDEWRKKSPEKERMIRVIKENLQRESPRTRENQKLGVISNFRCGCVVRMPSMINERYPLD